MKGLAALVISLLDLLEAEGRVFRVNALRLARSLVLQTAALLFGVAGLALLVAAAYQELAAWLSPALALCALAGICFLIFFALYWSSAKWTAKGAKKASKSN